MRAGGPISLTLPHSLSFKSKVSTASTPVHEKSVETLFSQDFLGAFIDTPSIEAPTKGEVLKCAKIPEEKQADPFVKLLVHNKSASLCNLRLHNGGLKNLHTGKLKTLEIAEEATVTEEISDSFVVVTYDDSVIGSLKKMSDEIDELYKDHIDNTNSLNPTSRQKDVNSYKTAQQYIREIHAAYIREKEQENAYIESFQAGNAAKQKLASSSTAIAQITQFAAPSSLNESTNNQPISVKTLVETIAKLNAFIDHIDQIKLSETYKKNSIKYKVSDFVTKHGVIETGAKIVGTVITGVLAGSLAGLAAGVVAGTVAATLGIALGFAMQYLLTQYASNVLRQFDNQYAFSEALKKILKSGLSKVEKMNGIGGVTSNQLGYTAGEINGSIQNLDKNLDRKLDKFVTQDQLSATVKEAVAEAVEQTVAKFVRPRASSTISNGSTLVGSTNSSRSNSPEFEELKKENAALHKKVEVLEAGQKETNDLLRMLIAQQANMNPANAVTRNA